MFGMGLVNALGNLLSTPAPAPSPPPVVSAGSGYTTPPFITLTPSAVLHGNPVTFVHIGEDTYADWRSDEDIYCDPAHGGGAWFECVGRFGRRAEQAKTVATVIAQGLGRAFGSGFHNAGIRVGEVEAWRCWQIGNRYREGDFTPEHHEESATLLCSCALAGYVWKPRRVMEADVLPTRDNQHGLHAWRSQELARNYIAHGAWNTHLFGKVKLWGRIVEHEDGYRAQYARITWLDTPFYSQPGSAAVGFEYRQLYGIPEIDKFDRMMMKIRG